MNLKDLTVTQIEELVSELEAVIIGLEKQISKIIFDNGQWTIVSDKNEKWNCLNLILSSPLPQTVKLLEETSRLNGFDNPKYLQLKKIR